MLWLLHGIHCFAGKVLLEKKTLAACGPWVHTPLPPSKVIVNNGTDGLEPCTLGGDLMNLFQLLVRAPRVCKKCSNYEIMCHLY